MAVAKPTPHLLVPPVPGKSSLSPSIARGEVSAGDGVGGGAARSEGPRCSLGRGINCSVKEKVSAGPWHFADAMRLNRARGLRAGIPTLLGKKLRDRR